jgi:hypothetical protein
MIFFSKKTAKLTQKVSANDFYALYSGGINEVTVELYTDTGEVVDVQMLNS